MFTVGFGWGMWCFDWSPWSLVAGVTHDLVDR